MCSSDLAQSTDVILADNGRIERHEVAWQTAMREVHEEAGLNLMALYSAGFCDEFYSPTLETVEVVPVFVGVRITRRHDRSAVAISMRVTERQPGSAIPVPCLSRLALIFPTRSTSAGWGMRLRPAGPGSAKERLPINAKVTPSAVAMALIHYGTTNWVRKGQRGLTR